MENKGLYMGRTCCLEYSPSTSPLERSCPHSSVALTTRAESLLSTSCVLGLACSKAVEKSTSITITRNRVL